MLAFLLGCATEDKPNDAEGGHAMMAATGGAIAHSGAGGHPPGNGAGGIGSGGALGVRHDSGTSSGNSDAGGYGGIGGDPGTDGGGGVDADGSVIPPIDWPSLQEAQFGEPVRISNAFALAEGALWDPCLGALLFTDVDSSLIHQLVPPDQISEFRAETNHANGINFDPQGRLLIAEMGVGSSSGRITRLDRAGTLEVVVDKGPDGVALHTTDDVIARSDGTIYFTDPVFPHGSSLAVDLFGQLPIYRVTPDKQVIEEGRTRGPNGLVLSPDEKLLYVASFFGGQVLKFDVAADGDLSATTALATGLDSPDSMCIDAAGNLYVGVTAGVQVITPDGTTVTTIPIVSTDGVTNCGFGGDDGKTLFVTAWTGLWRVEGMPIPGLEWQLNQGVRCD